MDNTIGKARYALLFVLLSSWMWAVSIDLKIKSLEGEPIEQAGLGVPFMVSVTWSGRDTSMKPHVAGLDSFQVQLVERGVHSVGRESTTTYNYKVRIDVPGNYIIGPATLEIENSKSSSKAVRIKVGENQIVDQAYAKKASSSRAFVRLSTDKKYAFVGERIECTVRFYGLKDITKLERVEAPKIAQATLGEKEGPVVGVETIDGVEYAVVTFKWPVYGQKEGQMVFPAIASDYIEEEKTNDFLSFFSPFFSVRAERKRTYSNALTVNIEALPAHKGAVNAIGNFKQIDARISPSVAQEGEGMVLTIEIEGEGDLQRLETPKLIDMPSGLKWYDSKQYIKDVKGVHGLPVKCFEYIVQGLSAGSWKIPGQPFEYFDVTQKKFVQLMTDEINVTINPAPSKLSNGGTKAKLEQPKMTPELSLLPLNMRGPVRQLQAQRMMPWWMFLVCALIPIFLGLFFGIRFIIEGQSYRIRQKMAFKRALSQIRAAQSQDKAQLLHTIFIELFESRILQRRAALSQDVIESILRSKNIAPDNLERWGDFYNHMYEYAFFDVSSKRSDPEIFKEAQQWISILEKIL